MARRALSGFLLVDKPAGPTSAAVVNKARHVLRAEKAGHAGTLDPAATGLLVVALGEATKALPFVTDALKAYDVLVRFGTETGTDDAAGAVTATSPARPADAEIEAALPAFRGDILQVPPAVSAVKVGGRRAYDLARAGEAANLAPRPLHVAELVMLARPDADHARLRMVCGKGGYVRSVARDLGRALGCLAHVEVLRRLWSGPFSLTDAATWDEMQAGGPALDARVLPLESALGGLAELPCDEAAATRVSHGNPVPAPAHPPGPAWASRDGRALALGAVEGGEFRPSRVILPA